MIAPSALLCGQVLADPALRAIQDVPLQELAGQNDFLHPASEALAHAERLLLPFCLVEDGEAGDGGGQIRVVGPEGLLVDGDGAAERSLPDAWWPFERDVTEVHQRQVLGYRGPNLKYTSYACKESAGRQMSACLSTTVRRIIIRRKIQD